MKVRVFTLRWEDGAGRFNDAELRGFLEDEHQEREVIEVSDHFFVHERRPVWAVMVMYRDVAELGTRRPDRDFRKDWRVEPDEPGRKLYDELRSWRGRTAKREGMPPYLICNNRQLAALAAKRPASLAAVREIEGLGEAKVERWGDEILKLIAAAPDASPAGSDGTATGEPAMQESEQAQPGAAPPTAVPKATDG